MAAANITWLNAIVIGSAITPSSIAGPNMEQVILFGEVTLNAVALIPLNLGVQPAYVVPANGVGVVMTRLQVQNSDPIFDGNLTVTVTNLGSLQPAVSTILLIPHTASYDLSCSVPCGVGSSIILIASVDGILSAAVSGTVPGMVN